MAKELKFDNVISMGVSYTWQNGVNSSSQSCSEINSGQEWVKRVKSVNLDVLNTDLPNQGGDVVQGMALNQEKYLDTSVADIYANGSYVGNGRMVGYSIKEGSQSSDIVSSLDYKIENGGADPDSDNIDDIDDPVTQEEYITVSRDIKNKTYSIEHSYSINYGSDFNLVSNHPLYSGNLNYQSTEARLLLGENKANQVLNVSPANYLQYIPSLAKYTAGNGWNLQAISSDCFGKNTTTTENKDFINGNYSLNKSIEISYTGEDIDTQNTDPWTVEYSMSWASSEIDGETCGTATMRGSVSAGGMLGAGQCGGNQISNSIAARNGYDDFVSGGKAKARMDSWYGEINELLPANSQSTLNPQMVNLQASQCSSSVQRGGASNNGSIEFSFEMNNCKKQKVTGGSPYVLSESTNTSTNKTEEGIVTEVTVKKSVKGKCGQQVSPSGQYIRYDSISSIQAPGDPIVPGGKPFRVKGESYSYNKYQAFQEWNITSTNGKKTEDGKNRNIGCEEESDGCGQFDTNEESNPATPRYVEATTSDGTIRVQRGRNLPVKTVSTSLSAKGTGCSNLELNTLLGKLKVELSSNTPSCIIQGMSWQYSSSYGGDTEIQGSVNGINL